ncbi:hypothetical protein GPLA_2035 [Paraglaciecola polaris LMG 21857]|uniref:Uncharacterized protein n=1 Tax=Paraglaciecola polaris LMG 21857 TaxID=1129793 RepID=K6Z9Y7_9ALTE|nr:hypothetical protein GPLA_2035 [Paraglaciecola polaris LMG 21857]
MSDKALIISAASSLQLSLKIWLKSPLAIFCATSTAWFNGNITERLNRIVRITVIIKAIMITTTIHIRLDPNVSFALILESSARLFWKAFSSYNTCVISPLNSKKPCSLYAFACLKSPCSYMAINFLCRTTYLSTLLSIRINSFLASSAVARACIFFFDAINDACTLLKRWRIGFFREGS